MDYLTNMSYNPEIAKRTKRIAASLIDFFIYWVIGYIIGIFYGEYHNDNDSMGYKLTGFPAFIFMLFWFLLIPINEGLTGQTLGKRILKIKVIRQDLTPTSISSSLVRHLFDIIDLMFLIGLIISLNNKNKQRIGDLVAKTYVVTKKENLHTTSGFVQAGQTE